MSPIDVLGKQPPSDRGPWSFLRIVPAGVVRVAVRLRASAKAERLLREAALREGRTGWSSAVLCEALERAVKDGFYTASNAVQLRGDRLCLSLTVEQTSAIASCLAEDQTQREVQHEATVARGHSAALELARACKQERLVQMAETGTDIRWGAMREFAKMVGLLCGLGVGVEPVQIKKPQFADRPCPDDAAMRAKANLQAVLEALESRGELTAFDSAHPSAIGPVRVNPRSNSPYTAVVLTTQLPGTDVMYTAWNVEPAAEGGQPGQG